MYIANKENKIYAYLLFLIWPFFTLLIAFKEFRYSWSKNILWFFTAFYAYSKIEPKHYTDSMGYRIQFEKFAEEGTFQVFMDSLFTTETDVFQPAIEFLVSRFTSDPKIYFLIVGIFYGYFLSRNIWFLLERSSKKLTYASIIIIIICLFILPIWNLNSIRFWLAAHIYIYGVFNYILLRKKTGILFILSTVLVHYAFILPIIFFALYLLLGNRMQLFFWFFIFSMFASEISGELLRGNSAFLPEIYKERVDGYTSENYKEGVANLMQGASWFILLITRVFSYTSAILFSIIFWKSRYFIKLDSRLLSIFSFTLLFFGFANLLSPFTSAARYLTIAYFLAFAVVFLYLQKFNENYLVKAIYFMIPLFAIFIFVTIRLGFSTMGLTTLFGNPLVSIFMEDDSSLFEFLN